MTDPLVSIQVEDAPEGPAALFGLDESALRRVVALALARAGISRPVELSILVAGDETLRALNRDYRGRDEPTDVLSFPLVDAPLVHAPADQLWGAADEPDAAEAGSPSPGQRDAEASGRVVPYDVDIEDVEHVAGEDSPDAGAPPVEEAPFAFVTPPDLPLHLGDVVIARGVTEQQAARAGHSAAWELAYLVAHGVLHLIGYDDHTEAGYAAMVAHQEAVLQQAGIPR
jgi:probable rRNA maturation factor